MSDHRERRISRRDDCLGCSGGSIHHTCGREPDAGRTSSRFDEAMDEAIRAEVEGDGGVGGRLAARRTLSTDLCDVGDCDQRHEWSVMVETTVPGRMAWNRARVCTDHVERVLPMMGMFAKGDRSYLTTVAQFDHDTREWVPTGDGEEQPIDESPEQQP